MNDGGYDYFNCKLLPDHYVKSKISGASLDPKKSASIKYNEVAVINHELTGKNYLVLIPSKIRFEELGKSIFLVQKKLCFVEVIEDDYMIMGYKIVDEPYIEEMLKFIFWINILNLNK
ncbi:MAG: hypothetical protein LBF68_05505 [Christensenellaceae bacterium]|jgi:hypothetical protein|nr:hypothetical protein [Christensenellaceae bacterium]